MYSSLSQSHLLYIAPEFSHEGYPLPHHRFNIVEFILPLQLESGLKREVKQLATKRSNYHYENMTLMIQQYTNSGKVVQRKSCNISERIPLAINPLDIVFLK